MTKTVTDEEGLALLEQIVNERPDYVYEKPGGDDASCVYVHNGAPSCLVGHWLHKLGVSLDDIPEGEAASDTARVLGLAVSTPLADALDGAQDTQDSGLNWAQALAAGKDCYDDADRDE